MHARFYTCLRVLFTRVYAFLHVCFVQYAQRKVLDTNQTLDTNTPSTFNVFNQRTRRARSSGYDMGLCMRAYELVGEKIEEIVQVYEMLKET